VIPIILGAVGAGWLISKMLGSDEELRANFPGVPKDWWTPRDRLFRVKEKAFVGLKQDDKLNELYREYAVGHPDHTFGLLLLTLADGNEGRWAESLELAQKLVALEPALSVGYWRVAVAAENLGQLELCEKTLQRFVKLEPESKLAPHVESWLSRIREQLTRRSLEKTKKKKPKPAAVVQSADEKAARLELLKARVRKLK